MISAEIQPTRIPEECKREVSLWAAVLHRAILDYKKGTGKVQESAQAWIESDENCVASFVWVCDIFDLNHKFAREKIQNA